MTKLQAGFQAAFAAACANRREIDATSLESVLEELWTSLIGDMRDATALGAASATCAAELDLMSTDEAEQREWRPEDDFAQNGAIAIAHAVRTYELNDPNEAVCASTMAGDAWDAHACHDLHGAGLVIHDARIETDLRAHPGMREIARQRRDLENLESDGGSEMIAKVRDRARGESTELAVLFDR